MVGVAAPGFESPPPSMNKNKCNCNHNDHSHVFLWIVVFWLILHVGHIADKVGL